VFDSLCSYLLHKARGRVVDTRRASAWTTWGLATFTCDTGVLVGAAAVEQRRSIGREAAFRAAACGMLSVPFEVLTEAALSLVAPDDVRRLASGSTSSSTPIVTSPLTATCTYGRCGATALT